jgi:hypothetical protein
MSAAILPAAARGSRAIVAPKSLPLMPATHRPSLPLRVHLTNVTALGPTEVVGSLLPALESCTELQLTDVFLPDRGELAGYARSSPGPAPRRHPPRTASPVSRILETTVLAGRFDGSTPILVLGDLPLRCRAPQVVLVQTSHIAGGPASPRWISAAKDYIARAVFKLNAPRVARFVVQTEVMKALLEAACPACRGKTDVIPNPPPAWLIESGLRRTGRVAAPGDALNLLYPAADYAHKNHALLSRIAASDTAHWPVATLGLTLPPRRHPNPAVPWIRCVGHLSHAEMIEAYSRVDALVYLSTSESYGLPLVEAMFAGLPILATDLPYARVLCGSEALYFAPDSIESMNQAVLNLHDRLSKGWWPDWSERLSAIPPDWATVANRFAETVRRALQSS